MIQSIQTDIIIGHVVHAAYILVDQPLKLKAPVQCTTNGNVTEEVHDDESLLQSQSYTKLLLKVQVYLSTNTIL